MTNASEEFTPDARAENECGMPRPALVSARWWERAACLGADTGAFFADPAAAPSGIAEAKAFCARCPVLPDCLGDALKTRDMYSVRGGMTWPERREAFPPARTRCPAGIHPRTPENSRANGRCRLCAITRETRKRAEERTARTGSSSPQQGRRLAA